jgi:hypothetical protein
MASNGLIEDASNEDATSTLIMITIIFLAIATVYTIAQMIGSLHYHSRLSTYYRSRVLIARCGFSAADFGQLVVALSPDHVRFGKGPEAPFAALASLPRIRGGSGDEG